MNRKSFILKSMVNTGLFFSIHSFLDAMGSSKSADAKMPVLFVGHGNPMNAIEKNKFSQSWAELGKKLPKPKAILCVSAHWLTRGTSVTATERPKTIHDFYGFPQELFDATYPAPGTPDFAAETKNLVTSATVGMDMEWGLDHGTWSVLLPMYPDADIPVFQLSIDYYRPAQYHYGLAKQLGKLREKGVLIIGSGNIVHNLRMVKFGGKPYDWALEFDEKIKELIDAGNHQALIDYEKLGPSAKLAIPTNDHYLPLMYSLGLQEKNEKVHYFNEVNDAASISMRSLIIG